MTPFKPQALGTFASALGAGPVGPTTRREWLVILPDNAQVLDKRIQIRPQHSPAFVNLHKRGWVSWAGPMFTSAAPLTHPRRPFCGSVMVVNESSPQRILEELSKDIYVKEGIWNLKETLIMPFETLVRRHSKKANS